jgi:hypothetical protein
MGQLELNSFAKGLNNFLDPANIGTEFASDLMDVSLERGILQSTKGNRLTSFTDETELNHYGKANRSVAKQFGRHYWSINDALQAPFYGGDSMDLGIQPPKELIRLSVVEAPVEEQEGTEEVYNLSGEYKYCYCYVVNGYESAPAEYNKDYYTSATVKKGKVQLYFESIPSWVQQVKIFRTINNGAEFYSLTLLDRNIVDGSTYEDNLADVDLLFGEPMECLNYLPPPDGGKYLIENQGAFFCAVDDKLYFSEIFNCHAWNPSNWISFDDNITGIVNEFQGLLVFTRNRVYKVVGNDISTIEKMEIPTHQGCVNYRTCATLSNAPIWLSNDGLCMWDGQSVKLISYGICRIDNQPIFGISGNDCYYLFGKNDVIVFDTTIGGVFYRLSAKATYGWYDADLDKVFYRNDTDIFILFGSNIDNDSFYSTGLLGSKLSKIEFRKLRVNSSNGYTVFIKDRKGRVFHKQTVEDIGTTEIFLPTSIWLNGCMFTFQFNGEIREILLRTMDY